MGLDLVMFAIAVEEAFQISIPDADLAGIATPGQLCEYLDIHLDKGGESRCLDQQAFYAVRQAGMRILKKPRASFTPDARWNDLIPKQRRRSHWNLLHHATGTSKWPALGIFGSFQEGCATVGGTARYVATVCPGAFKDRVKRWTRNDIERVVRGLMKEELAVDKFNWTDRFVTDLGFD